ncbi:ABC transporter ATP-binding protein [Bifidobacterium longum]|uniref:ABC transporter ATP-binding protein n=1 Tax=Bifidobacterium longum TaxID=216816 RepID=UPI0024C3B191|nr:ATP-binding cassette domain-containing protein [Bifidobacterium longum]
MRHLLKLETSNTSNPRQGVALLFRTRVLENVEMVARFGGKNFDPQAVLSDVGLGEKIHAFPQELSGGQLQRVAIARALCKNPQLLLCDEPTGALDSKTGQSVLKLLMRMSRQYRKTVIVVTHNSSIARIADVVVTIKDGKTESVQRNNNPESITQIQW